VTTAVSRHCTTNVPFHFTNVPWYRSGESYRSCHRILASFSSVKNHGIDLQCSGVAVLGSGMYVSFVYRYAE